MQSCILVLVLSLFMATFCILPVIAQAEITECGIPGAEGLAHPYPKLESWFDSCTERIQKVVDNEPKAKLMRSITCRFSVAKDGNISNLSFWSRSRDKELNECALEMIRQAAPFAPLPEGVVWSQQVVFDFNVSKLKSWMVIGPQVH